MNKPVTSHRPEGYASPELCIVVVKADRSFLLLSSLPTSGTNEDYHTSKEYKGIWE